jgi:hypothetical protein
MMIATYPFFSDISSFVGRLLSLHGFVAVSQIKQRMAEIWGERSTIEIAIPRVVHSMAQWGVLKESNERGVYSATGDPTPVSDSVAELLVEALLIDSEQESMEVGQLFGHAALFPFVVSVTAHRLRSVSHLRVHRQGLDQDVVGVIREGPER